MTTVKMLNFLSFESELFLHLFLLKY